MIVKGHDVDFGKDGTVKVIVIDPNVTPESQKRREEELRRVSREIARRQWGVELK